MMRISIPRKDRPYSSSARCSPQEFPPRCLWFGTWWLQSCSFSSLRLTKEFQCLPTCAGGHVRAALPPLTERESRAGNPNLQGTSQNTVPVPRFASIKGTSLSELSKPVLLKALSAQVKSQQLLPLSPLPNKGCHKQEMLQPCTGGWAWPDILSDFQAAFLKS